MPKVLIKIFAMVNFLPKFLALVPFSKKNHVYGIKIFILGGIQQLRGPNFDHF